MCTLAFVAGMLDHNIAVVGDGFSRFLLRHALCGLLDDIGKTGRAAYRVLSPTGIMTLSAFR